MSTLTAKVVAYSSVVGTSVALHNERGTAVALIMVSIPSPSFPYKETAVPIAERIAHLLNEHGVEIPAPE